MAEVAAIQDYMIFNVIRGRGGRATKTEIFEALGGGDEVRRVVEEKLSMMARFGLVVVEGDAVKIP